jgi:hypothetical protein
VRFFLQEKAIYGAGFAFFGMAIELLLKQK